MDETKPPPPPPPPLPKRRRRKNSSDGGGVSDDGGKHQPKVEANSKNDMVVASLVLLGDEEDKGQYRRDDDIEQRDIGDTHELRQIDQNHTQKKRHMMDYYSKLQEINRHGERETVELFQKAKSTATNGIVTAIAVGAATAQDSTSDEKSEKSPAPPQRRLWVKNRSKDWWDQCNSPDFPEEEFKKAFRMGKDTFDLICNELSSVVAKENTMLRDAVPVRQRVAVCVWRLATGEPLRLVSKKFGLGISTCHKLVLEVCSAIRNVLMPKYLRWPDEEGLRRIKEEFESMSGIPNVIGSMYTTHIPIIAPKNSVAAYFNRRHTERNQKTSYSITIQGVVDQRGIFTDVCIGYPGSLPDDQVLEKSTLFQRANTGFYQGIWIVGSSGYPLMDWILVPYTHQHLTWTQHAFNEKIGEIHRVSKESFRRLKTRWGCLQKRTEVKLQDLPVVLGACCVLHNICELRNEDLDSTPKFELIDDEMFPEIGLRSANAMKARDTIAHNLLHHNHAGTSFLS